MESLWQLVESVWTGIIQITSTLVIPDWGALIALLPVFIALGVLLFFAWIAVRYLNAGPKRRGPRRLPPATPEGIHMPGPSLAPALVATGAFALFFGLIFGTSSILFWVGLIALFGTLIYWLREGMRDYDALDAPTTLPAVVHGGPPAGVHMPGPSFRPFLVSAAFAVLFAGLIFGPVLLAGGALLVFITLVGWLRDAGHEYHATEAADRTGHLETESSPRYPTGTILAFVFVLAIAVGMSAASSTPSANGGSASDGTGGSPAASGGTDGSAAPSGPALEGDVVLHALNVQFDKTEATAPAGKPFTIAFANDDAGVPHNVAVHEGSATGKERFRGEIVNGPTTIVYQVPALEAGAYAFVCTVHPNMVGTLTVQ